MEKVRLAMEAALRQHWEPEARRDRDVPEDVPPPIASWPRGKRETPNRLPVTAPKNEETVAAGKPRSVQVRRNVLLRNRLIAAVPEHPQRESYRLLQAAVCERLGNETGTVIGVTRPCSGRGKTLTAVNLAISLAVDGHRNVLLIDLDLRSAPVRALFDVDTHHGIESCLFDGARVGDVWFRPSIAGLIVLPARGSTKAASQSLRSSSLKALMRELRRDRPEAVLIVNLPAITRREDAAGFEELVDSLLVVAEHGVTKEKHLRLALAAIDKRKLLGTVLNKSISG